VGSVFNVSNTFKIKSFIKERRVKNELGEYEIIKEKCVCFGQKIIMTGKKRNGKNSKF
jgi:hypothetical protein